MCALDTFMQRYTLHDPTSDARMLRPGARYTYHNVHRAPTRADLDAHLTGEGPIGVPRVGAAGIPTSGHHPAAEISPTHKALRLPGGRHTWMGNRGRLLLQIGDSIDLDRGTQAMRDARGAIAGLPQNAAARLPHLPVAPPREIARQTRQERLHAPINPIYHDNHTTDMIGLLERYGGRIAEQRPNGSIVLHGPCGQHQHHDAHASSEIRPARNTVRYGRYVAIGHAPPCRVYAEHRHVIDSFTVSCHLAGMSPLKALHCISRPGMGAPAGADSGTTRTGGQP
jgi:hypothetical protein